MFQLNTDYILIIIGGLLSTMFLGPVAFAGWIYWKNRKQTQHSLLRGNHWFLGILRYLIEAIGPEFRFYITDDDNSGKPISRIKYITIVKASKYLKTLVSFGSKRNFKEPGFYIKNSMLPLLNEELKLDNTTKLNTHRYVIDDETLFFRKEHRESVDVNPWLLQDEDALSVGDDRRHPWKLKGVIGMSGMSYGALGKNAITTLSKGISLAGGSWMNTGEGGLSDHHLSGGCDLIFQIGPGLFGIRNPDGTLSKEKLREKAAIPEVKAFEIKLAQGAKVRGGHVEGAKVNEEIAAIRGVTPWHTIDSPNRLPFVHSTSDLFDFIELVQEETGKPVGIKVVLADGHSLDEFCEEYKKRGRGPDFMTVDGGEGGTGATYSEMADSLGLPSYPALIIAHDTLTHHGIRDKIRIISSGKLHLPDEIAIALALGADMVNIARGFMITVGCIMAQKCHTNECPVGVATTNPKLERALSIDEKKQRVMNYLITLRAGLFSLSAACGLKHYREFSREHIAFKDENYKVWSVHEMFPGIGKKSNKPDLH